MKSKKEILNLLLKHPAKVGNLVGFLKLKEIHNEWMMEMLSAKDDRTLQAHRNSYKTTCVALILAILMVIRPNKRILFMRKTDDDVKEIVRQVKKILQTDHFRHFAMALWGVELQLTVDNATELSTNLTTDNRGSSQLTALGMGSSITGKHFDYIFTDDIITVKDRTSKQEREKTKTIYQELQNLKTEGGRIFNTGTPWHALDCFTIMPEPKRYTWEDTGIFTREEIEEKKKNMLPSLFAANYELRHIASEDVIFTLPHKGAERKECYHGLVHLDSAYGGEDFTALTVICKKNGKYYVLGKMWRKHVEQCYDDIIEIYNETMPRYLFSEDNGDKGFVVRDLKRKGLRTHSYHESTNKFIKITSILKVEWDKIEFVEGTDEAYLQQILDYNENAEYDDAPDSLACAVRKLYKK